MTVGERREKWQKQSIIEKKEKTLKCACGRKTHDKDGVCVICKIDNSSVIPRLDRGIQKAKTLDRPLKSDDDEQRRTSKINGGERMGSHKKCKKAECQKIAWKEGLCYKHWYQDHPDAEKYVPPGKKAKSEKQKANNPSLPPLGNAPSAPPLNVRGGRGSYGGEGGVTKDEIDILEQFRKLTREMLRKEITRIIAGIRADLDDLEAKLAG